VVSENVAVTLLTTSIVTTHVDAVPEQAPPQPVNDVPAPGVAVSVTEAFNA
jgi:hypothetical protein